MQTEHKFFEDMAKMASGAMSSFAHFKKELEQMIRHKIESYLKEMNFVSRDEFEAVKKMAARAREENIKLQTELEKLASSLKKK